MLQENLGLLFVEGVVFVRGPVVGPVVGGYPRIREPHVVALVR